MENAKLFYEKAGKQMHLAEILNDVLKINETIGKSTLEESIREIRSRHAELIAKVLSSDNSIELKDFCINFYKLLDSISEVAVDYSKI